MKHELLDWTGVKELRTVRNQKTQWDGMKETEMVVTKDVEVEEDEHGFATEEVEENLWRRLIVNLSDFQRRG